MLSKWILIFGIIFVISGCGNSNSDDIRNDMQTILETKWSDYANANMGGNGSIAIYITSPGGNYFLKTGNTSSAITADSHFRAASTTKTFTAAAIMLLQQKGKLNIESKLTDAIPETSRAYLPDTPAYAIPYKESITIKQLLEHRAGVFDLANNNIPPTVSQPYAGYTYENYIREVLGEEEHQFTLEELINVVAENQLSTNPPGLKFDYSDTGYSILGKIIEEVSLKSYHDFIHENFFALHALNGSSMPHLGNDLNLPSPFISGDIWYQNEYYPGESEGVYSTYNNVSARVAEGNLITTLENLSRWVRGWIKGEMGLTPETVSMMTDVQATGESHEYYGLGTVYTPGLGYGHNGAILGYLTIMRYDPQSDIAIIASVNIWNLDDFYSMLNIGYEILKAVKQTLE